MGCDLTKGSKIVQYGQVINSPIPRSHYKCRYEKVKGDDATNALFTRTKDVYRFPVPLEKTDWNVSYLEYSPTSFTSEKIKSKKGAYVDPDINEDKYKNVKFNDVDSEYNCDRKSHHGIYKMIPFNKENPTLVPRNPIGRTGIIGRGHLGHWGPNHAADSIVTQWRRDDYGNIVHNEVSGKPILQFISIQRRDTKEWAIPGGMIDPGEIVTKTLIREFVEEALSKNLKFGVSNQQNGASGIKDLKKLSINDITVNDSNTQVEETSEFKEKLTKIFSNGIVVYKGYVDDPRNTDNAWMETLACNFHDETSEIVSHFNLKGGDDAQNAKWIDLSSSLSFFASHKDFLQSVVEMHKAHW